MFKICFHYAIAHYAIALDGGKHKPLLSLVYDVICNFKKRIRVFQIAIFVITNCVSVISNYVSDELIEKYIPQKLLRGTKTRKPWIDKHIKSFYRKRNNLFNKNCQKTMELAFKFGNLVLHHWTVKYRSH